jgi:hypothetical protein
VAHTGAVVKGRGYIRTVNVEKSVGVFVMPKEK